MTAESHIHLNGEPATIAPGATLADVVARLPVPAGGRGVAVAVDAEVVPRGEWEERTLAGGERVEVLTAMQGG